MDGDTKTFETSATVQGPGEVRVVGVPFAPGTEVEVTISPKRASAQEFTSAWTQLCADLRRRAKGISQHKLSEEIKRYRTGR